MLRMKSVYRYRKERHFSQPPEAIWPFVADSARINELAGMPAYKVEERADAEGRIHRLASIKYGPIRVKWEEEFGEWQENRCLTQTRHFINGPFGRFIAAAEVHPEGTGSRMVFSAEFECLGVLGLLARLSGQIGREGDKRLGAIERMIRESETSDHLAGAIAREAAKPAACRRLGTLIADLAGDPASHGLAPRLAEFLLHTPIVALRSIRPLSMARFWHATPEDTVELFLAAQRLGIMVMGWDLLCPRCRGAKARVEHLHELPQAAHCSSCNIDYGRDFTRNVELTFHPEPWLRPLPEGELCLLGQGTTPHVKFQAEVAAHTHKRFAMALRPGPYRFRTVEVGGGADADIGADGMIPAVTASAAILRWGHPATRTKSSSATTPTGRCSSSSRIATGRATP
jgi:hypothetical protein